MGSIITEQDYDTWRQQANLDVARLRAYEESLPKKPVDQPLYSTKVLQEVDRMNEILNSARVKPKNQEK